MDKVALDVVTVGDRFRKDLGDIDGLAASMAEIGLLQPIGVTSDLFLVFGHRRLLAARQLGWQDIAARTVDLDAIVLGEYAENELRKDFTPSERVAIAEALRTYKSRGRPEKSPDLAISTDTAVKQAGFGSRQTFDNARSVVEQGTPELIDAMDHGAASISAAAEIAREAPERQREIVARGEGEILREAARIREERARTNAEERARLAAQKVEIPAGQYPCIVIDPPWPMKKIEREVRPNQVGLDYPTMDEAALATLSLPAAADCHLFVWTTHKFLPMALRLLDAWGFRYTCTFVWHKAGGYQPVGLPQYNCEFALYARRGAPAFIDTKSFPVCFEAPRREHSRKPDRFYEMIGRVTAGPRLDMFSREPRDGFDQWGNEPGKFAGAA